MEIKYINHSSFVIKTKSATVVLDPFSNSTGIKFSKIPADIVTISHSHEDHSNIGAIEGSPIVFDWPGEFEYQGVAVKGISTFHDAENGAKRGKNVMFRIISEKVNVLHCGDLGHDLDEKTIEEIGPVDVLMIPVGGTYTIDAQTAAHIVKKIDPAMVIPMHFQNEGLDKKTFAELEPVTDFLKLMGQSGIIPVPKLNLKHEDFTTESSTKVVLLETTS
jgi:L-ascorbate metabolism protein UlaG (beta-lactamase superfamily)